MCNCLINQAIFAYIFHLKICSRKKQILKPHQVFRPVVFNEEKKISLHTSFHEVFFGQACPITSFKPYFIYGSRLQVSREPQMFGFYVLYVISSLMTR